MKVAIIGAGISGLSAAYYLRTANNQLDQHHITVYEQAAQIGGHTATIDVSLDGQAYAIDTGFIVFNDRTYPNFIKLLEQLGVASQPTEMSFSVRCDDNNLEYSGSNINTLFAQRRNLMRPAFWGMLKDILRFNREAVIDLQRGYIDPEMTLGQYLQQNRYGQHFIVHYLLPMGCAIWSATAATLWDFPLLFFVRFFEHHGLLSVNDRPQWRVIKGGSRSYLAPLVAAFKEQIVCNARIRRVVRQPDGVVLVMQDGSQLYYDQVVMACHSDQALSLLADATAAEQEVLGSIAYRDNDVVLHTDSRLLPRCRRAWASWNYWQRPDADDLPVLTYNMNILQGLDAPHTFAVTLNATDAIDPDKILGRYCYSHPVFTLQSEAQVKRWSEINGFRHTWFCGAYWGNGFHEDGVVSGRRVAKGLNRVAATLNLRDAHRAGVTTRLGIEQPDQSRAV